jgi:hypothetical protein
MQFAGVFEPFGSLLGILTVSDCNGNPWAIIFVRCTSHAGLVAMFLRKEKRRDPEGGRGEGKHRELFVFLHGSALVSGESQTRSRGKFLSRSLFAESCGCCRSAPPCPPGS